MVHDKFSSSYYWITSVTVIIYNFLFPLITKPVMSIAGFHWKTREEMMISFTLFVCLFIDTILLPFFIGANFVEYQSKDFLDKYFVGKNTDFGVEWYKEVGIKIVATMIVFTFNPLIDFIADYIELCAHRWYSRNFVYNKNPGKYDKNDFLKYLDLNAGPEYSFETKLANTTMLVFVTLMLGPMLPLLYPVALVSIVVQYFTDKVFLTYFFRLPPKYSERLTLQNIKMMLAAPVLGLMVNYWAFGNRQMFENKTDTISTMGEVTYSHHLITHMSTMPSYTHLNWIFGMLVLVILLYFVILMYLVIDHRTNIKPVKLLPNYFNSLKI